MDEWRLAHDPEKWEPVFGQDHAQEEEQLDDRVARQRRDRRHPPGRARAVRRLPRRILAPARSRPRPSDRVRQSADRSGFPRRADPGGIRRQRAPAALAIMEEIQAAGCNGAACHAQMYTMGTVLRHGNADQKRRYLPKIATGELRLQAFGVTEPTSGTDTLALLTTAVRDDNDSYVINGQKILTSRAEHSDLMLLLARTTPREQIKRRTDGLSVFLVDMM